MNNYQKKGNRDLSNQKPYMSAKQRALNHFNPGFSTEDAFDARLDDITADDPRCVLLRDIYNAGTSGKRLDCEHVLEESRKYYPSCFTLQDVYGDLIEKTPYAALADVQCALFCFHRDQMETHCYSDKAAEPALSLG